MKANTPQRFDSVDALRGITVAAMLLVNNPGDWGHVYAPLLHSEWNGCTPTDLVFPFFLFIVGVSITLSLGRAQPGTPRGELVRSWLEASGVTVLVQAPGSGRTSSAAVTLDASGAATYDFDLAWDLGEVPEEDWA